MKATHNVKSAAKPSRPMVVPDAVMIRALSRYDFESPTGCHVSTYSAGSHGYAQIGWHDREMNRSRMTLCHRVVWIALFGPIPEGMTIDHTCKNRKCVNPEHLRMLDNFENGRRTFGRDWPLGQCAHGHSQEYLRQEPSGRLRCAACTADRQRAYRARKRVRS